MAWVGKKLVLRTVFFLKKIKNIELKMGGTPFGRQDFSVLSLPSPLVLLPLFSSLARVSRSLARLAFSRSSRVFSLVSRFLARLAFSRSSLALSRSSLASVYWFESMMCVYDVWYMLMLISAFLNECQKKVLSKKVLLEVQFILNTDR